MTKAENPQGIPNEGIPVADYRANFQSTPARTVEPGTSLLDRYIRSHAVTRPGTIPQEPTKPNPELRYDKAISR